MRRSTRVLLGGGIAMFLARAETPVGLILACVAIIWAVWPLIVEEEEDDGTD